MNYFALKFIITIDMSKKYFGGSDMGKGGWIIILDESGNIDYQTPNPTIGKDYDNSKFSQIFSELRKKYTKLHYVIENVNGSTKFGTVGNFSLGGCKELFKQVLSDFKIPHTPVLPKVWQKEMWEGVKLVRKPLTEKQRKIGRKQGEIDTKEMSFIAAQRLFPNVDFYITNNENKSKNFNHDYVDSVLIAEYCRRKFI